MQRRNRGYASLDLSHRTVVVGRSLMCGTVMFDDVKIIRGKIKLFNIALLRLCNTLKIS